MPRLLAPDPALDPVELRDAVQTGPGDRRPIAVERRLKAAPGSRIAYDELNACQVAIVSSEFAS